ncbi:MAG: hypothetical protein V1776_02365 [Candidatus Diapherotrites archaeon]
MANEKLFYGILVIAIIGVGVGLFVFNEPAALPQENTIIIEQSGGMGVFEPECADAAYLTNTADYILEGTIGKVESKEENINFTYSDLTGNVIFTYSELTVDQYIKGTPLTGDKIQIKTLGGCIEEKCLSVEDQPVFHSDKKVRIYFQETNGEFSIICPGQGGAEEI